MHFPSGYIALHFLAAGAARPRYDSVGRFSHDGSIRMSWRRLQISLFTFQLLEPPVLDKIRWMFS